MCVAPQPLFARRPFLSRVGGGRELGIAPVGLAPHMPKEGLDYVRSRVDSRWHSSFIARSAVPWTAPLITYGILPSTSLEDPSSTGTPRKSSIDQ